MSEVIQMKISTLIRYVALFGLMVVMGQGASAQNLFAQVARVNDSVVTEFEVQQRQRFLQLLNAPGSDRKTVIDALVDDRLRSALLTSVGGELSPEAAASGQSDFAARANLTTEEFVAALGQAGVDQETFRDFVNVSVLWRDYIRARYRGTVTISDAEIDRALGAGTSGSGIRVLLSEIIIPAPPQNAARVAALADQIAQSQSEAEFSNYARKYSATASRGNGGRMPWTELDKLPPSLHGLLLALAPGEVTSPLPIPNAIALFQLRGIEETGQPAQTYSEIDYAAYYIAGGRTEVGLAQAAKVRARVDVCKDLNAVAKGQPAEVLESGPKKPSEIPQDVAIELAKLDPGESSIALTRSNGQTLVFLMLCSRTAEVNAEVDRESVVASIRQRKLQGYADQLLQQLRADARILVSE
jgi:peptidyl-prolyl cis-trans isomerase SurA